MSRKRRTIKLFHALEVCINVLLVLNLAAALLLSIPSVRNQWGGALDLFCEVSIVIFVIEILTRIFLHPTRRGIHRFFRTRKGWNHWNLFDLTVTGISALSLFSGIEGLVGARVLRLLRLLSTGKVISRYRQLHDLTEAVFAAIPAILGAGLYILFITTLYAIVGVGLYRDTSPEFFGTLGEAYISLFQLMIFDDWGVIVRPLLSTHPFAWFYAVSFTLIAAFVLLNLVVGYLVDSIQRIRFDREFTSHQGLHHESDRLQEQLERFEKAFAVWQRQQQRSSAHKSPSAPASPSTPNTNSDGSDSN
ncbi:MAG: ion transporter [Bacteroidaceae bacterium]|nr:ion transporter [Bacteroidaceae bacterium]